MNLSSLGYLRLLVVLMFLANAVMAQNNDKNDHLGIDFKLSNDCAIITILQDTPSTKCINSLPKSAKIGWYQSDFQKQDPSDPQKQDPSDPQKQNPSDPQKQDPSDPQKQDPSTPQNTNPQKNYDPSNINPITGVSYVSQNNYTPLTVKERFHLYLKQTFMPPSAYLGSLFNAAVDVIHHDPPEWQLGAAGYGRRFALRWGNNLVQNSIQTVEAAALHEDQRYIVSQGKGFLHRMEHAFAYTFVTYNSNGKLTPNIAFVTSTYTGTMITTYGLPKRYTPLGDGVRDGNMQIVFSSVYNVVEEFWPDIMRMFKH